MAVVFIFVGVKKVEPTVVPRRLVISVTMSPNVDNIILSYTLTFFIGNYYGGGLVDGLNDSLTLGETLGLKEILTLGDLDIETDEDMLGDADIDTLGDLLTETEGLTDGLKDLDTLGETDGEIDGDKLTLCN